MRQPAQIDPEMIATYSPIERMFLDAYLDAAEAFDVAIASLCESDENIELRCYEGKHLMLWPRGGTVEDARGMYSIAHPHGKAWPSEDHDVMVARQVAFHGYKLDFALTSSSLPGFALCIEIDGHDWHERTKQQASQDRARDRELLILGVPTMRFTGSDVHRDANACARDVHRYFVDYHAHVEWWEGQVAISGAAHVLLEEHHGDTGAIDRAIPGWEGIARKSTRQAVHLRYRGRAWS